LTDLSPVVISRSSILSSLLRILSRGVPPQINGREVPPFLAILAIKANRSLSFIYFTGANGVVAGIGGGAGGAGAAGIWLVNLAGALKSSSTSISGLTSASGLVP